MSTAIVAFSSMSRNAVLPSDAFMEADRKHEMRRVHSSSSSNENQPSIQNIFERARMMRPNRSGSMLRSTSMTSLNQAQQKPRPASQVRRPRRSSSLETPRSHQDRSTSRNARSSDSRTTPPSGKVRRSSLGEDLKIHVPVPSETRSVRTPNSVSIRQEVKPSLTKSSNRSLTRQDSSSLLTIRTTRQVTRQDSSSKRPTRIELPQWGARFGRNGERKPFDRQDSCESLTLDDLGLEEELSVGSKSKDTSTRFLKSNGSIHNSNIWSASNKHSSLPMLESVASFGDSLASMTSTSSQISILREGKFSTRARNFNNSRSSVCSTLSESCNSVTFASMVIIINEQNPDRPTISRRPLPQAGPTLKMDTPFGHSFQSNASTNRRAAHSLPSLCKDRESLEHGRFTHSHERSSTRRNSLELLRTPAVLRQTEQNLVKKAANAKRAKANAAFASLGGMLQSR